MTTSPFRYFVLVLLAFVWCCTPLVGCSQRDSKQQNDIIIYMVRHAEKDPDPEAKDPLLTPEGQQRAQHLADSLANAGISAIYVTETQRAQLTAAPTAQRLGLTPVVIRMGEDVKTHAQAAADQILKHDSGGRVLVVGHTNTLPMIMQDLGVTNAPKIPDTEYDNFYVVILKKNREATLTKVTYGHIAAP